MIDNPPTAEQIREAFRYDKESGVFTRVRRKTRNGGWKECHSVPSSISAYGYLQVNVNGWPFMVHRLIFLYMTGEFPCADVDHVNGDRLDNRWCNLRSVSRQENLKNCGIKSSNSSGCVGVSFVKSDNRYHAYIGVGDGNRVNLGKFKTFEEAVSARKRAQVEFNFHPNHGARESWGR